MSNEQTDLNNLRKYLKDELLAINHYQEHIDASNNPEIQKLLRHIRDKEKEHVAELVMLIRQLDPTEDELFQNEGI